MSGQAGRMSIHDTSKYHVSLCVLFPTTDENMKTNIGITDNFRNGLLKRGVAVAERHSQHAL